LPDEHDVSLDISITRPWITPDRTARIEGTLTNEGERRRFFDPLPFDNAASADDPVRFFEDSANPRQPHPPNCTTEDEGKVAEPGGESAEGSAATFLEPGESVTRVAFLYDDLEIGGCYATGVYEFQRMQTVTVNENGDEGAEVSHRVSFSLGVQGENG
jgi:hypothetical protein